MQKAPKATTEPALKKYNAALLKLLRLKQRRASLTEPELDPRPLGLSENARKLWAAFADECERELAPGQRLEPVRAFANKLAEQALRLAAVLELVENPAASEVSADTFERAIELARYYAGEALRLFERGASSIEIQRAEKVLVWLHETWGKPTVGLAHIYQRGPSSVREAAIAREAMAILERHYWIIRLERGAKIDGRHHREAWEIRQH